jgi:hypothetical protein
MLLSMLLSMLASLCALQFPCVVEVAIVTLLLLLVLLLPVLAYPHSSIPCAVVVVRIRNETDG